MIGQKTINSFFSPVSKKRICKDLNEAYEDAKDPDYFKKGFVVSRGRFRVIQAAFTSTTVFLIVVQSGAHSHNSTRMLVLPCRRFLQLVSPPASRLLPALYFAQYTKIVQKKRRSSAVESGPSSPSAASLSPEQLDKIARNKRAALEKLASAQTPPGFAESWRKALANEFGKPYFKQVINFVSEERKRHTVYPPDEHVFTWTQMCDIRDVKVVILGQDPYHGPNQAHGLCFSVKRPVPPPPSLENMYKELVSDIEGFQHPGHGDLTGWAKQGVLLLNAVLTVRAHQANSHKDKGWETLTDAVVQWLSNNQEGLVFMLWGSYAQKKGATINRKRHHVLQAVHPSPLSAHRGFFGCKHFSKANDLLKKSGKSPINWKAL